MQNTNELSALSKTLFIPLSVRAAETASRAPVVVDEMAVAILRQCDTAGMVVDGGGIAAHGILARTQVMDAETKRFLSEHPRAIVVNLGAGLDTRFFRLDDGAVRWYDLDLPEVIALRKRFLDENGRLRFLSSSVLDDAWTREITREASDAVLIIAEGLLMYFSESDVREILRLLTAAFQGAEMLLDVVHPYFVGKKISSDFLWGVAEPKEIEAFAPGARILRAWSTGDLLKNRQPLLLRLMNANPSTRNRSRILHIQLKG